MVRGPDRSLMCCREREREREVGNVGGRVQVPSFRRVFQT